MALGGIRLSTLHDCVVIVFGKIVRPFDVVEAFFRLSVGDDLDTVTFGDVDVELLMRFSVNFTKSKLLLVRNEF